MKKKIIHFLVKQFPSIFYSTRSYGQDGDDLIIWSLLGKPSKRGFYVDIGAHDSWRYSNTAFFYRLGWTGINIDADPDAFINLSKWRKLDINLNFGIGLQKGVLEFHRFREGALNTFDETEAMVRRQQSDYLGKLDVEVRTLRSILDEHLQKGAQIDFLSIDVEGLDHEVLVSNDWDKFRPRIICVELRCRLSDIEKSSTHQFLISKSYILTSFNKRNAFYETK